MGDGLTQIAGRRSRQVLLDPGDDTVPGLKQAKQAGIATGVLFGKPGKSARPSVIWDAGSIELSRPIQQVVPREGRRFVLVPLAFVIPVVLTTVTA